MSSETVYTECLVKHDSRAFDHRFELPERDVARQILHPAIGRDYEPLGRNDLERGANSVGHHIRRLDSAVAETQVYHGDSRDALERAVERLDRELSCFIGPCLHVRLVDLHNVGARREEVLDLLIDGRRIVHRERLFVRIVSVLGLLAHRERSRKRDLNLASGMRPEKGQIPHLDRPLPPDWTVYKRDDIGSAAPGKPLSRELRVDAAKRGGEAVRVALPPDLAVRDNVDAGALHVVDRDDRGVVLRLLEPGLGNPPHLASTYPRRHPLAEVFAVDQPVGLWIAPNYGRRQKDLLAHLRPSVLCVHPRKAGVALTIENRVGFASDWDEELTKICDNL